MRKSHWTQTMQECYDRNCICTGCYQGKLLTSQKKCFVKRAIREYILKFGIPDFVETKKVTNDE